MTSSGCACFLSSASTEPSSNTLPADDTPSKQKQLFSGSSLPCQRKRSHRETREQGEGQGVSGMQLADAQPHVLGPSSRWGRGITHRNGFDDLAAQHAANDGSSGAELSSRATKHSAAAKERAHEHQCVCVCVCVCMFVCLCVCVRVRACLCAAR